MGLYGSRVGDMEELKSLSAKQVLGSDVFDAPRGGTAVRDLGDEESQHQADMLKGGNHNDDELPPVKPIAGVGGTKADEKRRAIKKKPPSAVLTSTSPGNASGTKKNADAKTEIKKRPAATEVKTRPAAALTKGPSELDGETTRRNYNKSRKFNLAWKSEALPAEVMEALKKAKEDADAGNGSYKENVDKVMNATYKEKEGSTQLALNLEHPLFTQIRSRIDWQWKTKSCERWQRAHNYVACVLQLSCPNKNTM